MSLPCRFFTKDKSFVLVSFTFQKYLSQRILQILHDTTIAKLPLTFWRYFPKFLRNRVSHSLVIGIYFPIFLWISYNTFFILSNCILKMLKQLQVARGSEVASGIFKEDFQNYGLSFFFFFILLKIQQLLIYMYQLRYFLGKIL